MKIKKINEKQLQINKDYEADNVDSNNVSIIFAKTNNRENVYIDRDLKSIEEEYYDEILDCFEAIQEGIKEDKPTKMKPFSNNKRLLQIHEAKRFKVRVVYKKVEPDIAYVYLAKMKKSDKDTYDIKSVEDRVIACKEDYERVKRDLKDPELKEQILKENQEIKERLYSFLKQNSRGR